VDLLQHKDPAGFYFDIFDFVDHLQEILVKTSRNMGRKEPKHHFSELGEGLDLKPMEKKPWTG
jgi:hypothetical protein